MSEVHLGVRISHELNDALEEAASEGRTSKSEMVRHFLSKGVLESETDLPEYVRREVKRERLKRKNRLTWQKVHFPSNVADRFRRAFEQGDLDGDLNPGAVEDLREIHVEDAELLFEDDPDRQEAAVEYVEALAEHASQASDASEFDRLDPEEMFERYAGVENGRQREDVDLNDVIRDARDRIGRLRDSPTATFRPDDLARSLAKDHGISEDLAFEAVERAVEGEGSDHV